MGVRGGQWQPTLGLRRLDLTQQARMANVVEILHTRSNPSSGVRRASMRDSRFVVCDAVFDWLYMHQHNASANKSADCDMLLYSLSKLTGYPSTSLAGHWSRRPPCTTRLWTMCTSCK